jgi:hypothetical protein
MSPDSLPPVKPQPTLKGYNAFVINNLVELKGHTAAEVVAWMVERWIDSNGEFLAEEFGITRDRYMAELSKTGVVLKHPAARTPDSA